MAGGGHDCLRHDLTADFTGRRTSHFTTTWGKQNCEDTGALDKKRMETVDQEFLDATLTSSTAPNWRGSTLPARTSGHSLSQKPKVKWVSAFIGRARCPGWTAS